MNLNKTVHPPVYFQLLVLVLAIVAIYKLIVQQSKHLFINLLAFSEVKKYFAICVIFEDVSEFVRVFCAYFQLILNKNKYPMN